MKGDFKQKRHPAAQAVSPEESTRRTEYQGRNHPQNLQQMKQKMRVFIHFTVKLSVRRTELRYRGKWHPQWKCLPSLFKFSTAAEGRAFLFARSSTRLKFQPEMEQAPYRFRPRQTAQITTLRAILTPLFSCCTIAQCAGAQLASLAERNFSFAAQVRRPQISLSEKTICCHIQKMKWNAAALPFQTKMWSE